MLLACTITFTAACGDDPHDAGPDAGPVIDAPIDGTDDLRPIGAACDGTDQCAPGDGNVDCHPVSSCDDFDCDKTCQVRRATCFPNPCGAGEVCDYTVSYNDIGPAAFCQVRHQPGEACQVRDRDLNDCVDGYECQWDSEDPFADPRCEPASSAPLTPLGQRCLNDEDCVHGAFCSYDYVCEARGALHASCQSGNIPCAPSLTCDFPAGLACEHWIDCGSNSACCTTATGSECRPGALDQCEPPTGSCEPLTLDNF